MYCDISIRLEMIIGLTNLIVDYDSKSVNNRDPRSRLRNRASMTHRRHWTLYIQPVTLSISIFFSILLLSRDLFLLKT